MIEALPVKDFFFFFTFSAFFYVCEIFETFIVSGTQFFLLVVLWAHGHSNET